MFKKKKKVCLCISLLFMGLFRSDVYASSIDDFRVDEHKLIEYTGTDSEVSIPTFITQIGSEAFADSKTLQKVNFHNSVTEIEFGAFENCSQLEEIRIPNSVETIGASAFSGCTELDTVYMGRGVRNIGTGAFSSCTSLEEIRVNTKNSYFSFHEGVLYNKGKTKIYQALAGSKEKSYTMPKSVKEIMEYAFWECDNLENIYLSNELKKISESAFANCTGLKSITIPYSVTKIEMLAFDGCEALENIRIPESVKMIHDTAFDGCINVKIDATEGSKGDEFAKNFYENNQTIKNQSTLSGNHLEGIKSPSNSFEDDKNNIKEENVEDEIKNVGAMPSYQMSEILGQSHIVGRNAFIMIERSKLKVFNTDDTRE